MTRPAITSRRVAPIYGWPPQVDGIDQWDVCRILCNNLRMHAVSEGMCPDSEPEYVELAVEVFSMLADPTRVRLILAMRSAGEVSVNRLAEVVGKSPAAVSQHLAKLRLARMVTTRQDGTKVFYRLVDEHASELVSEAIKQAEHAVANGTPPRHHTRTATR